MLSKSPPPLTHTKDKPGLVIPGNSSGPEVIVSELIVVLGDASSGGDEPRGEGGDPSTSLYKKVIYALTNPEGLNLGRQMGIHDDDAGEDVTEGE